MNIKEARKNWYQKDLSLRKRIWAIYSIQEKYNYPLPIYTVLQGSLCPNCEKKLDYEYYKGMGHLYTCLNCGYEYFQEISDPACTGSHFLISLINKFK
jgi:rubredoxin